MKYKPEYAAIAAEYAAKGATGRMLAAVFDVCEDTISRWKKKHAEFRRAMERATALADHEVESALYRQATGYSYETEEAKVVKDKNGNERLESVTITKHVPPRIQATQFWLKNRQPALWRDKTEVEHSGSMEDILAEVMNTSRGLPGEHPPATDWQRDHSKRRH